MEQLFSADSHIVEPTDVWTSRMPKAYADRAPYYVHEGDQLVGYINGKPYFSVDWDGFLMNEFPLDISARERLEVLGRNGIWGEALGGNMLMTLVMADDRDPDFALACARAFNDWAAETCAPLDGRMVIHPYIPVCIEPEVAAAEVERVAAMGLRSITVPLWPGEPYYLRKFDPIWEAAAAHKMPVCMHAHTGRWFRQMFFQDVDEPKIDGASMLEDDRDRASVITAGGGFSLPQQGLQAQKVAGWFIGSGTLERLPELHLVFLECGAAWMLASSLWLDEVWYRLPGAERTEGTPQALLSAGNWPLPLQPSEYMRRQIHSTFQFEKFAVELRNEIGLKNLMWGADTPHPEGTWPYTHEITDDLFGDIPKEEAAAMTGGTFAELFGIKVPTAV